MTPSYLEFLVAVALPPLLALSFLFRRSRVTIDRTAIRGTATLAVVALAYTVPWDNYLVARGVWEYAPGSVLLRLLRAPVEEYLFVLLQTGVVGLWVVALDPSVRSLDVDASDRLTGALAGGLFGLLGVSLLRGETYYLGAILAWAGPVLALQWGFGWPALWRARRIVLTGALVPATYFAFADAVAIRLGIWRFSTTRTLGVAPFGLPIEEALFFVLTSLLVVQGLLLFEWVIAQWR